MDEPQSQPRKRPRPVISCLRCREKKLKCDRRSPCENCVKASRQSGCTFSPQTFSSSSTGATPATEPEPTRTGKRVQRTNKQSQIYGAPVDTGLGIIEDLQARVSKLEELLAINHPSATSITQNPDISGPSSQTPQPVFPADSLGTLVVKGSRSRYHGQTDRVTLLNKFSEAKKFIKRVTTDPTITQLGKEVQFLQSKIPGQRPRKSNPNSGPSDASPTLLKLREVLPPRDVCDRLIDLYFENFEKMFRILHRTAFFRQYMRFWTNSSSETYEPAAFLAQLTAIIGIFLAFEGRHAELCDLQVTVTSDYEPIDLVETWLRELSRKQRLEPSTLQAEALLILARQARLDSADVIWTATGALLRSAINAGLHLNVSKSGNFSFFQAERRRRLWVTIVEMDMQASIVSGMPLMLPECDFNQLAPLNLYDTDYDEDTEESPVARPLDEFTDSLPQVVLASSMSQRVKAVSLVRNASVETSLHKFTQEGVELEVLLSSIPLPLRLQNSNQDQNGASNSFNHILFDVFIWRPLLCLYWPLLLGEELQGPTRERVQQICLNYSLRILSYQEYFEPNFANVSVCASNSLYWDMFQTFCRNDIQLAGLSVCRFIQTAAQNPSSPVTDVTAATQTSALPGLMQQKQVSTKANLTRIVDNTVSGLIKGISGTGGSLKDILFLAIVLQSVQTTSPPRLKEDLMHERTTKVLLACRETLLQSLESRDEISNRQAATQGVATNGVSSLQLPTPQVPSVASQTPHAEAEEQQQQLIQVEFLEEWPELATEFSSFQEDTDLLSDVFGDSGMLDFGS